MMGGYANGEVREGRRNNQTEQISDCVAMRTRLRLQCEGMRNKEFQKAGRELVVE